MIMCNQEVTCLVINIIKVLVGPFLLAVLLSYAAISRDALCSVSARTLISLVNEVNLVLVTMSKQRKRFISIGYMFVICTNY